MAKKQQKTRIANAKGSVPVQGYEDQVHQYRTDHFFAKQLTARIDKQKDEFRKHARNVLKGVEGAKRAEFIDHEGRTVAVSLPDLDKAGNRSDVATEQVKEALRLGLRPEDIDELFETHVSYTLTGPYVEVIEAYLAENFVSKGLEIPDGAAKKETRRLSVDGVAKLKALAAGKDDKAEAAKILLESGTRSPTVGVPGDDI